MKKETDPEFDHPTISPQERAQKLIAYLDQKVSLHVQLATSHHPQSFRSKIEEVFVTAEESLKEIKK